MRKLIVIAIVFALFNIHALSQVDNTSYTTQYGEKVLQLSIIVPLSKAEAWKLFTTDEGLKKWIAPVAKLI